MEWIETTAKTVDEAKDVALDRLGVAADEAEFELLEEPRAGLFGRMRGEARVRARVKPASVRPKQDRRNRGRRGGGKDNKRNEGGQRQRGGQRSNDRNDRNDRDHRDDDGGKRSQGGQRQRSRGGAAGSGRAKESNESTPRPAKQQKEQAMDDDAGSLVTPDEVGAAAVEFMSGLATAFGADASTEVTVDGTDIEVNVTGEELGLMVGPGGRTLTAVQDLARVSSQRRLGDHDTRLRVDVGGYREKRRTALEKFAAAVAEQVIDSGSSKALEPMSSPDRKVVHDAIADIDGVTSRSDGDDPRRRVVISPE